MAAIRTAAEKVGYQVSLRGRSLRTGKSYQIAVLMPLSVAKSHEWNGVEHAEILAGIAEGLEGSAYRIAFGHRAGQKVLTLRGAMPREASARQPLCADIDGFSLHGSSDLAQISRDPVDLAAQLLGPHHQYPDGAVLMLGTMFAPIVDRDQPDHGFTHHAGDVVRISSPALGSLVGQVQSSEGCAPWTFGIAALMRNLAARRLL